MTHPRPTEPEAELSPGSGQRPAGRVSLSQLTTSHGWAGHSIWTSRGTRSRKEEAEIKSVCFI